MNCPPPWECYVNPMCNIALYLSVLVIVCVYVCVCVCVHETSLMLVHPPCGLQQIHTALDKYFNICKNAYQWKNTFFLFNGDIQNLYFACAFLNRGVKSSTDGANFRLSMSQLDAKNGHISYRSIQKRRRIIKKETLYKSYKHFLNVLNVRCTYVVHIA